MHLIRLLPGLSMFFVVYSFMADLNKLAIKASHLFFIPQTGERTDQNNNNNKNNNSFNRNIS